jgi:hypothetical protein
MATPITNLIDSFMAPKYKGELDTVVGVSRASPAVDSCRSRAQRRRG